MSAIYFAIPTNAGQARIANAIALGIPLKITHMAIGDGNGQPVTPNPAQTSLAREVRRAPLNTLFQDPLNQAQLVAEQIIPEDTGGWWVREVGLYDDSGTLIAVANTPETYKPLLSSGAGRTQTIRMVLIVSDTSAVELKIDPSVVLATRKYVDDALELQRTVLRSMTGASQIGTDSGESVQDVINRAISVSFIFDDGYDSVRTVSKPLFDSYAAKFGIAIPVSYLGAPNRLTNQTLMEFARSGYEVLNHATSGDVMSDTTKGYGGVKGELGTCWDTLSQMGIEATGFVTPSSVLHDSYIDPISEYCDYAFTKAALTTPIKPGTPVKALHRFNLGVSSKSDCLAAIDKLKKCGGALIFYVHDVASGDGNYLKIDAILGKCAADSIAVLTPRECVSRSVAPVGNSVRKFVAADIIDNRIDNWGMTGGVTYTTDKNKDITVTVTGSGSFLFQKVVNINDQLDLVNLLTWSASVRDMNNILTNCSVAMKLYSDINGGGAELYKTTEESTHPNNGYVRYYAEAVEAGAKSALLYIRFSTSSAGKFLIRSPIFRFGSAISQRKYVDPIINNIHGTIPNQSITANTAFNPVTLIDVDSNGLFKVENSSFIFQKDATVMINISLVANGIGVATGWMGGSCALKIDGATSCISPVAGGNNHLAGCTAATLKVTSGTSVSVRCLASGLDFAIGSTNSRYIIAEL
ncbi:phage tail protein [Aeromonas media]|uniref:phage tail-collar fiber domain-containing protein n=1 Tax=Aeromonas media TaxID=651 RepID=UPI003D0154DC